LPLTVKQLGKRGPGSQREGLTSRGRKKKKYKFVVALSSGPGKGVPSKRRNFRLGNRRYSGKRGNHSSPIGGSSKERGRKKKEIRPVLLKKTGIPESRPRTGLCEES